MYLRKAAAEGQEGNWQLWPEQCWLGHRCKARLEQRDGGAGVRQWRQRIQTFLPRRLALAGGVNEEVTERQGDAKGPCFPFLAD